MTIRRLHAAGRLVTYHRAAAVVNASDRPLVAARIESGPTQREMAERFGVEQPALARREAGETTPTLDTLLRVAKAPQLDFAITPHAPLTVTPHQPASACYASLILERNTTFTTGRL